MVDTKLVRQMALFEDFDRKEIEELAELCSIREFSKGETLFAEERPATHLYTLLKGRVVIMMNGVRGQHALVYTVQPGQAFSWSAMVPPRRYTASAVAVEPSEALIVEGRKLAKLFKTRPQSGYKLMCRVAQLISKRLRHTRLQLLNIHDWQTPENSESKG
ncbi:MAG: hypothetical protein A3G34_06100 [Candidatus Lindowbacteria bacterium RIFCSPLOWO2_12_FULL_62_27]|nr:MAG: hypothetical protein A3G34_06100 [Candidatus Lindowbacteria bacterium RIFCSPLOWO2_12_FULL_62_27]OGH58747.1 MAG: hypothetical protein A3I06_09475 [Candidatus Lindowbacteria bacterium RIFCSPLOWO2_02_FULL_62_12]